MPAGTHPAAPAWRRKGGPQEGTSVALLHGAAPRRLSGTAVAGFARRTSPRNRAPRLVLNAPWVGTLLSEASDSARKQAVMQHIVFCLSSESHRSKKTLSRLLGTKFRDLRSMLHIAAIPLPLPPALRGSCGESLPWPDQLSSCRALINFMCGNCGGNVSCGPQTTEVTRRCNTSIICPQAAPNLVLTRLRCLWILS